VTVPDRLNWNSGAREPATVVSFWTQPAPDVLNGPQLDPIQMVRVRYDDGVAGDLPASAVDPI
jgi:hypothetical protein